MPAIGNISFIFLTGTFDIDISTLDFEGDKATQHMAVDIALTGYLGEETFMMLIQEINIVDEFEEGHAAKVTSLKNIRKHVERII